MPAYHIPYTYYMYFILEKATCLSVSFRHGSIPVSTVLWKLVRFFITNIFLVKNFKLSKLKSGKWFGESVNILSEWHRNPGKGTLGRSHPKGWSQSSLEVGSRSEFILDPHLTCTWNLLAWWGPPPVPGYWTAVLLCPGLSFVWLSCLSGFSHSLTGCRTDIDITNNNVASAEKHKRIAARPNFNIVYCLLFCLPKIKQIK